MEIRFRNILDYLQCHNIPYEVVGEAYETVYQHYKWLIPQLVDDGEHCIYLTCNPSDLLNLTLHHAGFLIASDVPLTVPLPAGCEGAIVQTKHLNTILSDILPSVFELENKRAAIKYVEQFVHVLVRDKGLKYILDISSDILQNPLLLCDISPFADEGRVSWYIYSSKSKARFEDIQHVIAHKSVPEIYSHEHRRFDTESGASSSHPFLLNKGLFEHSPRIISGIKIDGKLVAMLVLLGQDTPFQEQDFFLMEFLGLLVTKEIQSKGSPFDAMYEYQFQKILLNEVPTDEFTSQWLSARKWISVNRFKLCILAIDKSVRYQVEVAVRRKCADNPNIFITRLNNTVVLFGGYRRHSMINPKFLEELEQLLEPYTLHGIIGDEFSDIGELPKQYQRMLEAISVGKIMYPERKLVGYKELLPYYFVYKADLSGDIQAFLSSKMIALKEYDQKYGTDYSKTLEAFLLSGNRQKTAESLQVHKNTINYRLQKIYDIIGVDVENEDVKYELLQSYYIERFLNQKRLLETKQETNNLDETF